MFLIYELKESSKEISDTLSVLHKRAFPDFFLTKLGIPFLKTLYNGYLEDENSGVIIATDNDCIIGFIAYSNDYSNFYKGLINKHIFKFAMCSLVAAIRHPSFIKRLFGALKKSESVVKAEKYVELASICVDPLFENKGVGSLLINFLKESIDWNMYEYINLETDAVGNDNVNSFYIKNGFVLYREFTTAEGRKMNEYRYGKK